jgi:hypothetical protein
MDVPPNPRHFRSQDDPDTAISDGHKAIAKAKTANFGEGLANFWEGWLLWRNINQ